MFVYNRPTLKVTSFSLQNTKQNVVSGKLQDSRPSNYEMLLTPLYPLLPASVITLLSYSSLLLISVTCVFYYPFCFLTFVVTLSVYVVILPCC